MPVDRKLLADSQGRLYVNAQGQLADADCCCCACIVSNLPSVLEVTVEGTDFEGTVNPVIIETGGGDACEDRGYAGGPNDFGTSAFLDFLSPEATKWQLGLDNGDFTATLYKVASDGGCDIASPAGTYEGDGYTATVGVII